MQRLFLLLFICLSQYSFPHELSAISTVKVGIYNNKPLVFAGKDGQGNGIFADILEHIAAKEGWRLKYVEGTWRQCLSRLESGQIDILCTIGYSKERDKKYDFNKENLLTSWGQVYTSKDSEIKTIADLAGKKVAVLKGDIHHTSFKKIILDFGINCEIIETDDYHAVLNSISRKKVDAGVVNRFFGMQYGNMYDVAKSGVIFNPIKIHYAVGEGKNSGLIATMDKYIKAAKDDEDSVYYGALEKWFGVVKGHRKFPPWIKWSLVFAVSLLGLLFSGNIILRFQVNAKTKELLDRTNDLQDSQEQYRTLFELSPDAILIWQGDTIINANSAAMRLLGADTLDELVGKTCWQILPTEYHAQFKERYQSVFGNEQTLPPIDYEFIRLDGEKITTEASTTLIQFQNQKVAISVYRDITDHKQLESEKANLETRLQQAQKMESIGTLAGGIAHDFNNILSPIIGLSELLMEDLNSDSPECEMVTEIYKAGRRAGDLVKQILTFSRQGEPRRIPIRIQHVLEEVIKLIRSTIPANINIIQNIQSDCGMVRSDPTQLHQIAMNLITNAYHAIDQENGEISVKLNERELCGEEWPDGFFDTGEFAVLSISDNGSGIDPAVINKIFEPYFTTKGQDKGTGLGLSVVYGIVKENGGDIRVMSEIGKGTTFDVYLPILNDTTKTDTLFMLNKDLTGTEKILLVDDEEVIVQMEKKMLERYGYHVEERTSSIEALKAFKANPEAFDMVITDMNMPNMTGTQFARELISIKPGIPIILCTGFSDKIDEQRAKAMGISGFIMKPVISSDISQMIRDVIDGI